MKMSYQDKYFQILKFIQDDLIWNVFVPHTLNVNKLCKINNKTHKIMIIQ